ncbi:MAG: bifunctional 5,10-methylenetetrahydrofolate dehydrogenase/5,10-methenyltetrahydrofolate cyclohydrolase, partial [Candidatus Jacksonbacteria bacterium]
DDKKVSAIIVQFPLPKNFDADAIVKTIDPKKDADGFHLENIKKFLELDDLSGLLHKNLLLPVTPAAIMEILNVIARRNKATTKQSQQVKNIKTILVGKSSIFTKPLIHYFSSFQIISPSDPKLALKSRSADILITACGKPRFIKANMIKQGAIVIDVGINRFNNKVTGDVDFDSVAPKTSFITAVPGGVGPVTVAVLLRNVVYSALLEKIS